MRVVLDTRTRAWFSVMTLSKLSPGNKKEEHLKNTNPLKYQFNKKGDKKTHAKKGIDHQWSGKNTHC